MARSKLILLGLLACGACTFPNITIIETGSTSSAGGASTSSSPDTTTSTGSSPDGSTSDATTTTATGEGGTPSTASSGGAPATTGSSSAGGASGSTSSTSSTSDTSSSSTGGMVTCKDACTEDVNDSTGCTKECASGDDCDCDGDGYIHNDAICKAAHPSKPVDCYDCNANAYPGQKNYFLKTRGDSGALAFDYDCNNLAEPLFTTDCGAGDLSCSATNAFMTSNPGCGNTGTLLSCTTPALSVCKTSNPNQSIQSCH